VGNTGHQSGFTAAAAAAAWLQVWDFGASADARDTEGGASKRSLLEQVEKMRSYLAAEQVAQQ
jgi:hypothetical protein